MATRTWTGQGADALASNVSNWDGGVSAPAAGDDVVFDGVYSGTGNDPCTWDVITALNTLDLQSGYSGNFTLSAALNVNSGASQTLTFNSVSTFNSAGLAVTVGTGGFNASGTATKTLTMGASVWDIAGSFDISGTNLTFNANTSEVRISSTGTVTSKSGADFYKFSGNKASAFTITLGSDITVTNTFNANLGNDNVTYNGFSITAQGDISATTTYNVTGTTTLTISGTANQIWSSSAGSGEASTGWGLSPTINKTGGTLTLSGTIRITAASWTYTAGTVAAGTSTISIRNSITWNDATTQFYNWQGDRAATRTVTLSSDLYITNAFDGNTQNDHFTYNGNNIYASGNILATTTYHILGTSILQIQGTAVQTFTSSAGTGAGATNGYDLDIVVNKSGGSITFSGSMILGGNFTYTAGTVVTTGSTVKTARSKNWNSGTIAWNNFTVGAFAGTTTLTGNLSVTGTLLITETLSAGSNTITCAGNFTKNGTFTAGTSTVVFNGTSTVAGATTFNNLTISNLAIVHLTSTQTFTVSGAFTTTGASTLDAVTGGSRANLPVNGSQSVTGVTATDIDSSGGSVKPIINTGGTNSNTVQWSLVAATFANHMSLLGVG